MKLDFRDGTPDHDGDRESWIVKCRITGEAITDYVVAADDDRGRLDIVRMVNGCFVFDPEIDDYRIDIMWRPIVIHRLVRAPENGAFGPPR